MNVITLAGRAGRDPEAKYFDSGTVVANLRLAVNNSKKDEKPDWFDLQIWGKTAQIAVDYVRKGSQIAVTGRMVTERWTDRSSGEERSKMVVAVDRLTLLGSRQDQEHQFTPPASAAPAAPAPVRTAPARAAAPAAFDESEVPF